jgi:hypothetical protein
MVIINYTTPFALRFTENLSTARPSLWECGDMLSPSLFPCFAAARHALARLEASEVILYTSTPHAFRTAQNSDAVKHRRS